MKKEKFKNKKPLVIKVEFVQRKTDGKWIEYSLISDNANVYKYKNENGQAKKLTPLKWIVTNVYDYMLEFVEPIEFVK